MEERRERCICCAEEIQVGEACTCGFSGENYDQTPYLKMGTVLQERYVVGKMQSANGEGASYVAFDRVDGSKVLLKEFFPQTVAFREENGVTVSAMSGGEETFQYTKEEFLSYSRKIAHCRDYPAILSVFDIFSENGTAYAVYEWCTGGTLKEYIERKGTPMSWNLAKALFLPLISSIKGMHENGLGHFGIAPENLLIFSDGRMKLGGFSIQDIRHEEQDLSPELFSGCAAIEQYSSNEPLAEYTDIYGLCACLFYALTMQLPQEATRRKYDSRLLIANDILQRIPSFVVAALAGGLQVMPEKRIQTFELLYHQLIGGEVMNETKEPVAEQTEKKEKAKKDPFLIPPFILGFGSFVLALAIFCLIGWSYLKNRFGDDVFYFEVFMPSTSNSEDPLASSQGSSDGSSSESGTSSNEAVSVPDHYVAVPDFVNRDYKEIKDHPDFNVLLSSRVFHDTVEEGMVISQSLTGYAELGSVITVVVSRGPMMREFPDIANKPLNEAKTALLQAGFQIGMVTYEPSEKETGIVLRASNSSLVAGKKYEYGTVVNLIVAQSIFDNEASSEQPSNIQSEPDTQLTQENPTE